MSKVTKEEVLIDIYWYVLGLLEDNEFQKYLNEEVGIDDVTDMDDFRNRYFNDWDFEFYETYEEIMKVLNIISDRNGEQINE